MEPVRPKYRFELKGKIISSGWKSLNEFTKELGCSYSTLHQIVTGWKFPSSEMQVRIAKKLGLTIRELSELL